MLVCIVIYFFVYDKTKTRTSDESQKPSNPYRRFELSVKTNETQTTKFNTVEVKNSNKIDSFNLVKINIDTNININTNVEPLLNVKTNEVLDIDLMNTKTNRFTPEVINYFLQYGKNPAVFVDPYTSKSSPD